MSGTWLGAFALPLAVYVMAMVNLDFWEAQFLAAGQSERMLVYSSTRLTLRMLVVVLSAYLSRNVTVVIWSLTGFEVARLLGAIFVWRAKRGEDSRIDRELLRDQLRFCIPTGVTAVIVMLSRNLGSFVVARLLGPVALARYTVGTYAEPFIGAVTGAVSTVTLPEMVRRQTAGGLGASLAVWQEASIVTSSLVLPLLLALGLEAREVIEFVFGPSYVEAAPVMQIFLLVVARSCVDFAVPLRAIGKARPFVVCNIVGLIANAALLWVLFRPYGMIGAVIAFTLSAMIEPLLLAPIVLREYQVSLTRLLPWREFAKAGAGLIAGAAASIGFERWLSGEAFLWTVIECVVCVLAYLATLVMLRAKVIDQALTLLQGRAVRG